MNINYYLAIFSPEPHALPYGDWFSEWRRGGKEALIKMIEKEVEQESRRLFWMEEDGEAERFHTMCDRQGQRLNVEALKESLRRAKNMMF